MAALGPITQLAHQVFYARLATPKVQSRPVLRIVEPLDSPATHVLALDLTPGAGETR